MAYKAHKLGKAKIVGNTAHHNVPLGTVVTITNAKRTTSNGSYYVFEYPNYQFFHQDLESLALTKEELQKEHSVKVDEIKQIELKIQWMDETGAKEYDDTEFKAYGILKTLGEKSSDYEKAKAIAKIINKD